MRGGKILFPAFVDVDAVADRAGKAEQNRNHYKGFVCHQPQIAAAAKNQRNIANDTQHGGKCAALQQDKDAKQANDRRNAEHAQQIPAQFAFEQVAVRRNSHRNDKPFRLVALEQFVEQVGKQAFGRPASLLEPGKQLGVRLQPVLFEDLRQLPQILYIALRRFC